MERAKLLSLIWKGWTEKGKKTEKFNFDFCSRIHLTDLKLKDLTFLESIRLLGLWFLHSKTNRRVGWEKLYI